MGKYCLVGVDGNAIAVMGYVSLAMQETGFTKDEINSYRKEAMSSDYDHLLAVSDEMVDKCNEIAGDSDIDFDEADGEIDLEDEE